MRAIEYTARFKRDIKREKKGQHRTIVDELLAKAVSLLIEDAKLPAVYSDHPLSGTWKDYRDCHLKPDLILIYRKIDPPEPKDPKAPKPQGILQLVRIGSHSELF